ncbi:MAG: hypothetical protein A2X86_02115 [Bdellovibrionales bacterium GWA2_49_15]|nr:MAG: hypothetical protein A2X86_02115 [Bdellovibrionales bacterium GWA2_49_15]
MEAAQPKELTPQTPWQEFRQSFAQNKGAVIGLVVLIFFLAVGITSPFLAPYNPAQLFDGAYRLPPAFVTGGSTKFLLGTDDVGRDILSRLIHGTALSLGVGLMIVVVSLFSGTILGLLAGYFEKSVDRAIMRLTDIIMALPSTLLAIVVAAILGPGLVNAVWAVSIVAIPNYIRLVRALVMAEKKRAYVMAAQAYGAGHIRIMVGEILPNCMAPIIVQATLGLSEGILNAAALGFLGLGAQPPTPEWGTMLADARPFLESSPWMVTFPGLCILLVVLALNLVGDGLRDALDPRLKK